jgi:hypothetical protein
MRTLILGLSFLFSFSCMVIADISGQSDEISLPTEVLEGDEGGVRGSHTEGNLNIQNARPFGKMNDPVGGVSPNVRNVLIDPRRKQREDEKAALKGKPKADENVAIPGSPSPYQLAVEQQAKAWEQFLKITKLTGIYNYNDNGMVVFQLLGSQKSMRLILGESRKIVLDNPDSIRRTIAPVRNSSNQNGEAFILNSIAIKPLKITTQTIYFVIDEINGASFFDDEKPIWTYHIQP